MGRPGPGVLVAMLTATLLELAYAQWRPAAPDLAAQLARASAASRGADLWWAGWYGGINTAPYSAVGAAAMSAVGVVTTGLVATTVICLGGADLVRRSARPRLGAAAIALAACANLFAGRITFAGGMACTVLLFCLLQRERRRPAAFAALLAGLVSPLAALAAVMGLCALTVAATQRWRSHLLLAGLAVAPVLLIATVLGQPSVMPFTPAACVLTLLVCSAVVAAPVPTVVRSLGVVAGLVTVAAFLVPSPVGHNVVRLPMLLAAPLVLATARRNGRRTWLLVGALLAWPVANLSSELAVASHPSSRAAEQRSTPRSSSTCHPPARRCSASRCSTRRRTGPPSTCPSR